MSTATETTAVTNLIARYAELVDAGDFAGVGELFADGEFAGGGGSVRGSAGVEKMLRGTVIRYEDGTPRTHHVTTNIAVEFDDTGDVADSRAYFTVFQALPDFPLQAVVTGRYRDRFERRDGRWRFARREVTITLTGDVTRHLRYSLS
ncbi:nuclear transport factor 2 family protein [Nocardia sp. ET3-3]|uniref:Nuclear transport factor 2 family protein n=1 Tax=Nocardia terrae TaxID=2675851 RepID=A0A7K1V9H8_9NOCA|nr:nuclear transport factor 2 family protein [Nocardia terrae]MVU83295.1 nuclear transport factor 2 family protein [Nocardia terrae]